MAKKIKIVQKKIKKPDEFLSFTDRMFKYFNENKQLSLGILSGVILALILFNLFSYTTRTRREKADRLLVEAFSILNTPLTEELSETSILRGAKSYSSSMERADEAIKKLNEVIKKFGGSEAGIEARFHLGEVYLGKGDYANAISTFQDFLKRVEDKKAEDDFFKYPAYLGLAKAYYEQGDDKNADDYFQKVIDSKQDAYMPEALLGKAKILTRQGKVEEAKEKLDSIIKNYPGSVYEQLAQIEMNRLSSANPVK